VACVSLFSSASSFPVVVENAFLIRKYITSNCVRSSGITGNHLQHFRECFFSCSFVCRERGCISSDTCTCRSRPPDGFHFPCDICILTLMYFVTVFVSFDKVI
jgi:hypothetical protein